MPDRHTVILNSVKKLLDLGVTDDEIIVHLREVGVPESEARDYLNQAKGNPPQIPKEPESSGAVFSEVKEELAESPESELPFAISEPQAPASFKRKVDPVSQANLADLWEKGILQTVTDKLQEMKSLHDQIDSVLDQKIEKSLAKEVKKMNALFESQQTLLAAKLSASTEKKSREFNEMIDAKIGELKKLKDEKKSQESAIVVKQEMARETFERLTKELEAVQKQRVALLQDFNAELIKSKSQMEELVEDARQKLVALEERATQTLELETAIIDGMVKEAQNRIDRLAVEKMDDLTKDVRTALTEFEALKVNLNLEDAQTQLQRIASLEQTFQGRVDSAVQAVAKQIEDRIESDLRSRLKSFDKEQKEVVSNIDAAMIKSDLKELRQLKEELKKELAKLKKK